MGLGGGGVLAPGGPVPRMLAAAICLDTQNLDTAATRCTPRDVVGGGHTIIYPATSSKRTCNNPSFLELNCK
jgi:hypothetical protein